MGLKFYFGWGISERRDLRRGRIRGYFQRQFEVFTRSKWIALFLQAALFGISHGYQGLGTYVKIDDLRHGLLALWRASLRPGMIAHAGSDIFDVRSMSGEQYVTVLVSSFVYVLLREPQRTVDSIMRILRQERYLRDLSLTAEGAFKYWEAAYRNVLHQRLTVGGEWIFLHYDEILDGNAIPILEERIGASVDREMPRAELKRSRMVEGIGLSAQQLYEELCELSVVKYSLS